KPCRRRWILAPKEFGSVVQAGLMARRFRARNGIGKAKFLCTRCEQRSITDLPKPIPFTEKSESNVGCVRRRSLPFSLLLHRHRRQLRHQSRLKSKEKFYAVDAKTREVSKVPAGKPQGNRFAQSKDRFWRIRVANTRACLDHEHAIGSRACCAHS